MVQANHKMKNYISKVRKMINTLLVNKELEGNQEDFISKEVS